MRKIVKTRDLDKLEQKLDRKHAERERQARRASSRREKEISFAAMITVEPRGR